MTAGTFAEPVHFADHEDDYGMCGAQGFLVGTWEHVTCEACHSARGERGAKIIDLFEALKTSLEKRK